MTTATPTAPSSFDADVDHTNAPAANPAKPEPGSARSLTSEAPILAEAEAETETPTVDDRPVPGGLRRLTKSRKFKHYNRLVWLVTAINAIVAFVIFNDGVWRNPTTVSPTTISNLVVINLTVAVLIRQQYVVNGLFWLATRAPTSWPLKVRWTLGKVYHFGGIHTSAATIATVWFLVNLGLITAAAVGPNPLVARPVLAANWALATLLIAIVATALPFVRQRYHDRFELIHRLGGWSALVLFWVVTLAPAAAAGRVLTTPAVYALMAVTFSVALPWMRLKKVPVDVVTPSDHVALADFDYGYTPFAGSSTAISQSPLLEWHAFANVPVPGREGFGLTISRAGDWTGQFIDEPPSHVWVKGICTAGVANIEVLFKKVVYVATGSGIGPCMPHLLAGEVPAHLIWATRNPVKTYGEEMVNTILEIQPDAVIWDTDANGKPDMVELAYQAVLETGAEAVICISNPKLTWQVVEGIEKRGIPAYGAIWDS